MTGIWLFLVTDSVRDSLKDRNRRQEAEQSRWAKERQIHSLARSVIP